MPSAVQIIEGVVLGIVETSWVIVVVDGESTVFTDVDVWLLSQKVGL